MLLSTDWFFDWWQTLELSVPERKRFCVQMGCRDIVRAFMSTAKEYWLISFETQRMADTRKRFFDALGQCRLNKAAVARMEDLASGRAQANVASEDKGNIWLMASLTEDLVSRHSHDSGLLDPAARGQIEKAWKAIDRMEVDLEKLCLNSDSEWDRYIRSTTPDLPMMLTDYLSQELITQDKFVRFWCNISSKLPATQKQELIRWYGTAARSLTGQDFHVPSWMTQP
jgi:hypothetical protein